MMLMLGHRKSAAVLRSGLALTFGGAFLVGLLLVGDCPLDWVGILGMDEHGTVNAGDALDAASWGAMYWLAIGDLERAERSLVHADLAYSNTVAVSPTLSIWGYKPYSGTAEGFDWSGS